MKLTKEQTYLISAAVVVLICIAIYQIGRFLGQRSGAKDNLGVLPQNTDWGASLTDIEATDIQNTARNLHQDMKGLNFSRDISIYTNYLSKPERIFVGVANFFYNNYGSGDNLAKWIKKENFYWTSLVAGKEIKTQLLEKLASYGIVP